MTTAGHPRGSGTTTPGRCLVPCLGRCLALGLALALAGCSGNGSGEDRGSGGSSASSSASPSASSTTEAATASSSPTRERPPKAPAPARGPAGQKRFARHMMDLWGYALRTDDARALVALSAPGSPCRGCTAFATSMQKRRKQGWYVDFPGVRVRTVTVRPVDGNVYARAKVDVPQSDSYDTDGSFRNTNAAHRGATFEVLMHRGKKRFQLLAFTVS